MLGQQEGRNRFIASLDDHGPPRSSEADPRAEKSCFRAAVDYIDASHDRLACVDLIINLK